jgi:hypothetical protein
MALSTRDIDIGKHTELGFNAGIAVLFLCDRWVSDYLRTEKKLRAGFVRSLQFYRNCFARIFSVLL